MIGAAALRTSVYVIGCEVARIKVGISRDPEQRLADLQCGSPVKLALVHVEPLAPELRPQAVEGKAHDLLEPNWAHGEWFNASVEQAIAAIWWAIKLIEQKSQSGQKPVRDVLAKQCEVSSWIAADVSGATWFRLSRQATGRL